MSAPKVLAGGYRWSLHDRLAVYLTKQDGRVMLHVEDDIGNCLVVPLKDFLSQELVRMDL